MKYILLILVTFFCLSTSSKTADIEESSENYINYVPYGIANSSPRGHTRSPKNVSFLPITWIDTNIIHLKWTTVIPYVYVYISDGDNNVIIQSFFVGETGAISNLNINSLPSGDYRLNLVINSEGFIGEFSL